MKHYQISNFLKKSLFCTTILSLCVVPVAGAAGRVMQFPLPSMQNGGDQPMTIDCHDNGNDRDDFDQGFIWNSPFDDREGQGITRLINSLPFDEVGNGSAVIREGYSGDFHDLIFRADCHNGSRDRFFGPEKARRTVARLQDTEDYCSDILLPYLIDCIAAKYEQIASELGSRGDSGEIKKAFSTAAAKLRSIVRQTEDTTLEPSRQRIKKDGKTRSAPRRLNAIQPARQAAAVAAANTVIAELETVLLRSAENSESRKIYFAQVADAVDSNKVLLRS